MISTYAFEFINILEWKEMRFEFEESAMVYWENILLGNLKVDFVSIFNVDFGMIFYLYWHRVSGFVC